MVKVAINHLAALAMDELQLSVENKVISFALRGSFATAMLASTSRLTPRDRMDISDWRDTARTAGYDRMIIHDRDDGDAQEVGDFLSVYRSGESWSRWGFARQGGAIIGWCCLTSTDTGQFGSLAEALGTVLGCGAQMMLPAIDRSAVVTELAARRRACERSLGSAA